MKKIHAKLKWSTILRRLVVIDTNLKFKKDCTTIYKYSAQQRAYVAVTSASDIEHNKQVFIDKYVPATHAVSYHELYK